MAIDGLFAGESMFSRARDASKVALIGLVDLLRDEHADRRLLDTQWQTPHLATLGVVEISTGSSYLERLAVALQLPLPVAFGGTPPDPEAEVGSTGSVRRRAEARRRRRPSADRPRPSRSSRRRG